MPVPNRDPRLIVDTGELARVCMQLSGMDAIAMDTEFNRTSTYRPELCLVQIAGAEGPAIVDLLADLDLQPLRSVLATDPSMKIFHAAKQDLEALYLNFDILPNRIIDTQIAAALLGHPPQIGYAQLVKTVLGVELDKSETRTDWARRPLTSAQLHYAADDVVYLAPLQEQLAEELRRTGRLDWALEDSGRLLEPALYAPAPQEAWRRLGGLPYMPVAIQARARALAAWRESRAATINRPRQWVLADKALLGIATAAPRDEQTLTALPDVPPAVARRQGSAILDALAEGDRALADDRWQLQRETRPGPAAQAGIKKLAAVVNSAAEQLGVAPEIVATRKELAMLLRGDRDQRCLTGWRREVAGQALLDALPDLAGDQSPSASLRRA